jgi:hypothetical protein
MAFSKRARFRTEDSEFAGRDAVKHTFLSEASWRLHRASHRLTVGNRIPARPSSQNKPNHRKPTMSQQIVIET